MCVCRLPEWVYEELRPKTRSIASPDDSKRGTTHFSISISFLRLTYRIFITCRPFVQPHTTNRPYGPACGSHCHTGPSSASKHSDAHLAPRHGLLKGPQCSVCKQYCFLEQVRLLYTYSVSVRVWLWNTRPFMRI